MFHQEGFLLFTQVKRIKVFHRRSKSLTEEKDGKVEDKKKNAQLCSQVFLLTTRASGLHIKF